jgi:transcriptional pleiotropic regulator of transition state genes
MTEIRSGIERRLDAMGRIVIPAEIRDALGLAGGDALDISVRDGVVVLAPVGERCPRCGHVRGTDGDGVPLRAVPLVADATAETNGHGS